MVFIFQNFMFASDERQMTDSGPYGRKKQRCSEAECI